MYLQHYSICRWNALKHVAGDKLHVRLGWSLGNNMGKIEHATLNVWEHLWDGLGCCTNAPDNVDEWANPLEDMCALLDGKVHDELDVRSQPIID